MNIEVFLVVVVAMLLALIGSLIFLVIKIQTAICKMQADFHTVSNQVVELITSSRQAIETSQKGLPFLEPLLGFFSGKKDSSPSKMETISQLIGWIGSTFILIKKIKKEVGHDQ